MSEQERSREALEHQALEAKGKETEQTQYVERPRGQRVLAWILAGAVIVGVLLYFGWIAGILH